MTNSWMNEDGEPIMDGAAWRFEQQLDMDSRDDYYADRFYDNEPDPIDPEDCDGHPDWDSTGWTAECAHCLAEGLIIRHGAWDAGDELAETIVIWTA